MVTPVPRPLQSNSEADGDARIQMLKSVWNDAGFLSGAESWVPLHGGRTNHVWSIRRPAGDVICKLYQPNATTPLFANDPASEVLALAALKGTGLAPTYIAGAQTPLGHTVLLSKLQGQRWRGAKNSVEDIAHILHRLHQITPPVGLPKQTGGAFHLSKQGQNMLSEIGAAGYDLSEHFPQTPTLPIIRSVFLHGDPVPGNILEGGAQPVLIDWQCPAVGNPCDDLALFLSPAMQIVNGNPPLTPGQEQAFLTAYGDDEVTTRLDTLRPLYHWRMAIYCRWKALNGDAAYGQAEHVERDRLTAARPAK